MRFTNDDFTTLTIKSARSSTYRNRVWLTKQNHKDASYNVLNISPDLAIALSLLDSDQVYRFDLQVTKDHTHFALYFNPVGLCNMKNRRCVNINLVRTLQSQLISLYPTDFDQILVFEAEADVKNSRIIFTPIVKENI